MPKKSLKEQLTNVPKNPNESSLYTEESENSVRNYQKEIFKQGINWTEAEGNRSEPDVNYYPNCLKDQNEEIIDDEPKKKKVNVLIDTEDNVELEISQDQSYELGNYQGNNNPNNNVKTVDLGEIKLGEQQQSVIPNLNDKLNDKESQQKNNIEEFQKGMKQVKLDKRVTLKDQLICNMKANDNNTTMTLNTEEGNLPVLKKLKQKSNEDKIEVEKENFNSQERSIPNDSFYNSVKDNNNEILEEEPKFEEVELEEEEDDESEDEDQNYNKKK